jgi:hypothetical protein
MSQLRSLSHAVVERDGEIERLRDENERKEREIVRLTRDAAAKEETIRLFTERLSYLEQEINQLRDAKK